MRDAIQFRIAPPAWLSGKWPSHPRIVRACLMTSSDRRTPAVIWSPPTENEWRQAVLVIAKQVTMRIAGYLDEDEFARDGCRFAWDVFETLPLPTRRDYLRRTDWRKGARLDSRITQNLYGHRNMKSRS
jgi:hypothetical protein